MPLANIRSGQTRIIPLGKGLFHFACMGINLANSADFGFRVGNFGTGNSRTTRRVSRDPRVGIEIRIPLDTDFEYGI